MPLTFSAKGSPGNFKPCPEGPQVAICNIVADLGLQPGSGIYPDPKQKVYIRWEIPSERVKYEKDGKPAEGPQVINKQYTASMHEKATLRKDLESWRGRRFTDEEASQFDIGSILGKPCLINVVHAVKGDQTYANIGTIMPVPKQLLVGNLRAENELIFYAEDSKAQFSKLPPKVQEMIKNPARQAASHASGIYTSPEMASQYDNTESYTFANQEQPPIEAYNDAEQYITDADIPDFDEPPF